ncbi:hypothetical protein DERF_010489 [Dermatophagoides farinae]|uniref:Uncharacterized protein n=1 Tax=Dermatophagoides farinae TaxID=6954 RepID=A0A922I082_DERFA|nr:hypothetical protein DERF_010489 [Dermatophagoides farinae]
MNNQSVVRNNNNEHHESSSNELIDLMIEFHSNRSKADDEFHSKRSKLDDEFHSKRSKLDDEFHSKRSKIDDEFLNELLKIQMKNNYSINEMKNDQQSSNAAMSSPNKTIPTTTYEKNESRQSKLTTSIDRNSTANNNPIENVQSQTNRRQQQQKQQQTNSIVRQTTTQKQSNQTAIPNNNGLKRKSGHHYVVSNDNNDFRLKKTPKISAQQTIVIANNLNMNDKNDSIVVDDDDDDDDDYENSRSSAHIPLYRFPCSHNGCQYVTNNNKYMNNHVKHHDGIMFCWSVASQELGNLFSCCSFYLFLKFSDDFGVWQQSVCPSSGARRSCSDHPFLVRFLPAQIFE